MQIILASNNKNKLREVRQILEPLGYEVVSQSEAGIDIDVDETGSTFEENAFLKANAVHRICSKAVIADDSGLEVDALDKAPGIYSARYCEGTDKDRCAKLLKNMENVADDKRTARFVCTICYIDSNGNAQTVRGDCEGNIGYEPMGENGFGYDPVFMYGNKSFAELSAEEKNSISHRAKALQKLGDLLK